MKQSNLILCNVFNPLLKPLLKENNEKPVQTTTLLITFNSAKISDVVIKLNQKPQNIIAKLANQTKSNQQDLEYIKFNYFTYENHKVIYNSSVNTNKFYTSLEIQLKQNDIAFFSIQLYGQEAIKVKQSVLDNFIFQPSQYGTQNNFTDAKRDKAAEGQKQQMNKIVLKEKEQQELEEAVEKSLISAQYEEINKRQIIESINNVDYFQQKKEYQFQEYEELNLEILMGDNDLKKYQYEYKKQPQVSENFGYTDNKNVTNFGFTRNTQDKKECQQQTNNDDPIKIYFMTKYKANDINLAFMKMHQLMEETSGRKRFLENVMYN